MDASPTRRKVTLAWNGEDVARAMGTLFEKGDPAKYIDLPLSNYSTWPNDKRHGDGEHGRRLDVLRLQLQRALDALARRSSTSDVELGTEVTLVWGEEGGGSAKPVVERHVQAEIRAIVSPCPYARGRAHVVRRGLADGVRLTLTDDGRRSPSHGHAGRAARPAGLLRRRDRDRHEPRARVGERERRGARRSPASWPTTLASTCCRSRTTRAATRCSRRTRSART